MMKITSEAEYITKASVEFFPSRVELYSFLDNFIEKNGLKKDYTSDNKDSMIVFSFKNPDTAFEFVKSINLEKLKNPLYSKIKTNMYLDVKQHKDMGKIKYKSNTNLQGVKMRNNMNNLNNLKNIKNPLSSSVNPLSSRLTNSLDLTQLNKSTSYHQNHYPRSESTGVSNSIGSHNILLISTPYISEDEKIKMEFKENKKKWVINNDFSKYIGKATINRQAYIPNYVNLTPSEPPVNYQFRQIYKDKWLAKKNFFV